MSDEYTENMSPSYDGIPLKLRIETETVNDEVFSLKENVIKAITGQQAKATIYAHSFKSGKFNAKLYAERPDGVYYVYLITY